MGEDTMTVSKMWICDDLGNEFVIFDREENKKKILADAQQELTDLLTYSINYIYYDGILRKNAPVVDMLKRKILLVIRCKNNEITLKQLKTSIKNLENKYKQLWQ